MKGRATDSAEAVVVDEAPKQKTKVKGRATDSADAVVADEAPKQRPR